jgi:hypothetical protein
MTIKSIPKFRKHMEYLEQNPYIGKNKYRFVTNREISIHHNLKIDKQYRFIVNDRIWLRITQHSIIVSKEYAWDGCTPKIWKGIWWGVPDFNENILASLIHDILLQFHKEEFPFTREQIDMIFKDIMINSGFKLWWIYYNVVKLYTYATSEKR